MNNAAELQALQSALAKHRNGQVAEAEAEYQAILNTSPDNTEALRLYGMLLLHMNQPDRAESLLRRAVSLRLNAANLHAALGEALRVSGKIEEATQSFERATRLDAADPEALTYLARLYLQMNRADDASTALRKAVGLRDSYWQAHLALGDALLRQRNFKDANQHFRKAYENVPLNPSMNGSRASALAGIGATAIAAGNVPAARGAFAQAVAMAPDDPRLHMQVGALCKTIGEFAEAEKHFKRALELNPNLADAHRMLGGLVGQRGEHSASLEHLKRAIELNPHDHALHSGILMSLIYTDEIAPPQIFEAHVEWGRQHAGKFDGAPPAIENPDPDRRLRIAYVSPDFRSHAVSSFSIPLLEHHDRDRYEVIAYHTGDKFDPITDRIRSIVSQFYDVHNLTDEDFASRVRADKIDILIDLSGHTDQARLLAFARRPAPVQVTYLGYPGTTGVPAIGYRLTDAIADPPGTEALHVEKLLRVDGCFLCYSPIETSNEISPPPRASNGFVTFGSFNNTTKISATTAKLWASALNAVPDSRLMIKSTKLSDHASRESLSQLLQQHGIAEDRVALLGPQPNFLLHLADYAHVDIALDTFPYNGTTTTCEALWMGVPVITLAGGHHAARVGASLLTALGRPDWIASDPDEFAKIAAATAQSTPDRAELRTMLQCSRLMDAGAHARALEMQLRKAWREICAGVGRV